ncbi:MAG: hypothetical protein KF789_12340 [Bdellovibrionaceae bacterium]|nr:hypothetical protein [Pseudobdellovibrionaceae bacterium]
MIAKKKWILLICLSAFLWSCSDDDGGKRSPKPKVDYGEQEALGFISVLDENDRPLNGAKVLIGNALNSPFSGNFLTTNQRGQVMAPEAWEQALPVTVQANGYVRVTHFLRAPGGATFRLQPHATPPSIQLSGTTTGHTIKDNDGFIDFGLVISALTRNDILAFDLTKVISSQMDSISVVGQKLDIPSNVALPRQRETYLLPIRLEKPAYRLSFAKEGVQRVFAAQGRFPFKAVIDEARREVPFYDLINHFSITGGVVRDIQIKGPGKVDLPVNELSFSTRRNFKAPALGSNEVMISMAVASLNGWLVPTDVKKLGSNETRALSVMNSGEVLALGVLKNSNEFDGAGVDRLSAVLSPFPTSGFTPQFVSLIPDPQVLNNGDLRFSRPSQTPSSVNALATIAIYSEIKEIPTNNGKTMPFLSRIWEVHAPKWVDGMNLPTWPDGTPKPLKKRWEVAYIGSQKQQNAELGQAVIDAATHVTHSSKDF